MESEWTDWRYLKGKIPISLENDGSQNICSSNSCSRISRHHLLSILKRSRWAESWFLSLQELLKKDPSTKAEVEINHKSLNFRVKKRWLNCLKLDFSDSSSGLASRVNFVLLTILSTCSSFKEFFGLHKGSTLSFPSSPPPFLTVYILSSSWKTA